MIKNKFEFTIICEFAQSLFKASANAESVLKCEYTHANEYDFIYKMKLEHVDLQIRVSHFFHVIFFFFFYILYYTISRFWFVFFDFLMVIPSSRRNFIYEIT